MKIDMLTQKDKVDYLKFLNSFEYSLFYYSIEYKIFLENLLGCQSEYFLVKQEDKIIAVLPLMKKKGKYGLVYNSLPFYGSNGGILSHDKKATELLLNEYKKIINSDDVASSVLIENPFYKIDYASIIENNFSDKRDAQFTSLKIIDDNFEEELLKVFDSTTRRNIKKAIKSDVVIKIDNSEIEFLFETHKENMLSIGGRSKEDTFFELFPKIFIQNQDYRIYVAKKDGQNIASLLLFYFNNTVEYYIPTIMSDYRTFQPLSLLIYTAMIDAKKNGYSSWNWGGTWPSQEGVKKFKNKWNTQNVEYNYYIKLNNKKILGLSQEEIIKEYGNFYVVPFNELYYNKMENK